MLKNKKKFIILAAVVLVLMVVLVFRVKRNGRENWTIIKKGTLHESVYGLGTMTSNKSYTLKLAVANNVVKVFGREGDQIKKGDALIQFSEGPIFRTPIDGVITQINYKEGESVSPQTPILQVVNKDDRYILVSVEQQAAIKIRPNMSVSMSFESLRNETYKGKVETVYAHQGQFFVRVSADELPSQILPGMTLDVAIELKTHENALIIPAAALQNKSLVRKRNGSRDTIEVTLGVADADRVEVLSGDLAEGDEVLIPGPKK
jgi:multidrug efflux pump subunit AcrA (membrane-fusion protein)